ncbi:aminotransferase class V-fold PLP-dependent enzyme [Nocardioides salsibiostraticola]
MSHHPTPIGARLDALQAEDLPIHTGRTLAYVYDSGLAEVDRLAAAAVGQFAASNGLDPTAFPSMLQMENDLVGFAGRLLDAPEGYVGSVTSGGTESVLLAVQAARDGATLPAGTTPVMVLPDTAHSAFHKAAHYFGVATRVVPAGPDFRADVEATRTALDEAGDAVVLVVTSAPSYAHGVVDPVTEIAALAAERGIRCHVDACIGGMVLPYAARLGREVRPWTFAVDGVTSISVDLHKYGYTPKGTSILLHRTPALRRTHFFAWADWPGYTMLNTTVQSTKSGGPLAGAWTVVETIGDEGYESLCRDTFEATDRIAAGIKAASALRLVAEPDSTLIAFTTDASCDPFTVVDEMNVRGWYVQPQLSYLGQPANIHLSVSAATLPHVEEFLTALDESVAAAVEAGPVEVDAGVAAYVAALDPQGLTDADFDGLLQAAGLIPETPVAGESGDSGDTLSLPTRRAGINALLDLASPALREAVLIAFLDRLSRPTP